MLKRRIFAVLLTMIMLFSSSLIAPIASAAEGASGGVIVSDPTAFGADPSGKNDSAVAIWSAFEHVKVLNPDGSKRFSKEEYHIYKDYAQKREYHTFNTNSIENPIKWNALLIEKTKNLRSMAMVLCSFCTAI